ncbi:MAG: DUF952 domain-containing protein [Anaerolineaceae bacterium]|jgi:uncharacterized protein (DUF952 family)|nr:DUF952 domain-containing protein [Anaerolineaceae bacterium]OQY90230.1 MAG: hypothetical protein B6D38_04400 [Anaerolineae bacterium UTCFX1]
MIYHLTFRTSWRHALAIGSYAADSLKTEGFIHCSTQSQLVPVAMNFFAARRKLTILAIDESKLTAPVKWEAPAGGPPPGVPEDDTFPHVYGSINLDAVVKTLDMERNADDIFVLPDNL